MLKFLHVNDNPGPSANNGNSSILESSTDSLFQHQAILSTELYAEIEKILVEEENSVINNN